LIYRVSEWYEIVLFTASIPEYAEPLFQRIDRHRVAAAHLFRDHCTFHNGLYVKDLSKLGRPLSDIILLDNSPLSSLFQPENAIPCTSWYEDKLDRELLHLIPILEKLSFQPDVRVLLPQMKDAEGEKFYFDRARDLLGLP
jgi:carboxy-terminal domain RNA polymerase II polypeptide A small phosphatase